MEKAPGFQIKRARKVRGQRPISAIINYKSEIAQRPISKFETNPKFKYQMSKTVLPVKLERILDFGICSLIVCVIRKPSILFNKLHIFFISVFVLNFVFRSFEFVSNFVLGISDLKLYVNCNKK